MLKLEIQLFGGRGASSNKNSKRSFSLKKDVTTSDGTIIKQGTKMTGVVEIAGGKRRRKIDDINRLVNSYGGKAKDWSKRRATAVINGEPKEVHFYQNKRLGNFEYKIKG